MSGFARAIGRWFRKPTAEPTPAPKDGIYHPRPAWAFTWLPPPDCGTDVSGQLSLEPQGTVDLERIVHAADNLEAILGDFADSDNPDIDIFATKESGALFAGAWEELHLALEPYRRAKGDL